MFCPARLGSGFFGRAATCAASSCSEDESWELLSLSSLSRSLIGDEEDELEADSSSSERAPCLPYSKTPSPRFYER